MFDTSLIGSGDASMFDTNRLVMNGNAPSIFEYIQKDPNNPLIGISSMLMDQAKINNREYAYGKMKGSLPGTSAGKRVKTSGNYMN